MKEILLQISRRKDMTIQMLYPKLIEHLSIDIDHILETIHDEENKKKLIAKLVSKMIELQYIKS